MSEIDLDALRTILDKAHTHVCDLAQGLTRWKMTIPANEEADSDLILASAITGALSLLAEVRQLREDDALACAILAQRDTEIRLLREQRDQVLALLDRAERLGKHPGSDRLAAVRTQPAVLTEAVRAIYASSAHPSTLEAQK
ncbi:hypothetical protein Rhe02_54600 [Rhizocola hellebori]|uniref:Uncharacterized protein n=1 Tax=Rhizocola hellebori TaxID=1392758 RepID=A0A8J3VIX6_9ACTN|nr:hypothetical protein [Rhizocola hellebori]GIH07393.1 hypothetical protein Rhe02_54600 [Rhizocola hellebori]